VECDAVDGEDVVLEVEIVFKDVADEPSEVDGQAEEVMIQIPPNDFTASFS
jgi:hypothetical protein